MHRLLQEFRLTTPPHELRIADDVWKNKDLFVRWPTRSFLFMPDVVRTRGFHSYTSSQLAQINNSNLKRETRSNGPAVMAFGIAGGVRPLRAGLKRGWSIHHIYDGKHPAQGSSASTHAVKNGRFFTEAAGLVAAHPIADALADEVPYFAWLLRYEAFGRFGFDPDEVFAANSLK